LAKLQKKPSRSAGNSETPRHALERGRDSVPFEKRRVGKGPGHRRHYTDPANKKASAPGMEIAGFRRSGRCHGPGRAIFGTTLTAARLFKQIEKSAGYILDRNNRFVSDSFGRDESSRF
jgi:hypothetical protein